MLLPLRGENNALAKISNKSTEPVISVHPMPAKKLWSGITNSPPPSGCYNPSSPALELCQVNICKRVASLRSDAHGFHFVAIFSRTIPAIRSGLISQTTICCASQETYSSKRSTKWSTCFLVAACSTRGHKNSSLCSVQWLKRNQAGWRSRQCALSPPGLSLAFPLHLKRANDIGEHAQKCMRCQTAAWVELALLEYHPKLARARKF